MGDILKLRDIVGISSDSCWITNWLLDGICISIQVYRLFTLTESAKAKGETYKRRKLQAFHPVLAVSGTWRVTSWIMQGLVFWCPVIFNTHKKKIKNWCLFHVCLIWYVEVYHLCLATLAGIHMHIWKHLPCHTGRVIGLEVNGRIKGLRCGGLYIFNSPFVPESSSLDKSSEALSSVSFRHTV